MQTSSSIQRLHVEAMELVHSGSVFSDALVHFTTMHNRIAGDDTQARPPGQWPPHPRPMMTFCVPYHAPCETRFSQLSYAVLEKRAMAFFTYSSATSPSPSRSRRIIR